jgi:hypothetical protein
MIRGFFVCLAALLLVAEPAAARRADHGRSDDVRVAAVCTHGASATLRVRARDTGLEVRFQVRQTTGHGAWRISIVHENRVAARAVAKTTRSGDSFELRRSLTDLPGSDGVAVHAWGPNGLGCRATVTMTP